MVRQFALYSAVGAIGTAVHYATLILLVERLHVKPLFATTAGFSFGAIANYLLNYHLTFASRSRHSAAVIKYLTLAAIGALLNGGIMMSVMPLVGHDHYLMAQIVATGCVLVLNFFGNRLWTFA